MLIGNLRVGLRKQVIKIGPNNKTGRFETWSLYLLINGENEVMYVFLMI